VPYIGLRRRTRYLMALTRGFAPVRVGRMPSRLSGPAVLLVALVTVSGCGGGSGAPSTARTTDPTGTPSAPTGSVSSPGAPATGTSGAMPSAPSSPSAGCSTHTLADGSWSGPVRMDVQGQGGRTTFTSSQGEGTLALTVSGGRVTGGRWTVTWHSTGSAETANAKADLALRGTIAGRAGGTASRPTLTGTWHIVGTARITRPVQTSAPVDESGPDTEKLTVRTAGCDDATATFLPSFNSKDTLSTFRGEASWTGHRS